MDYECKKCGSECMVEYDAGEGYWPECWCDHCDDYEVDKLVEPEDRLAIR